MVARGYSQQFVQFVQLLHRWQLLDYQPTDSANKLTAVFSKSFTGFLLRIFYSHQAWPIERHEGIQSSWVIINYTITQVDFVIKTFAGTPLESPDHCINAKRTTSVSFRAICLLVNGIISLRHWRLVKGVPAHGVNFRVRNFNQTTWTSFFMNLYTLLLLCTFKRARRMWC